MNISHYQFGKNTIRHKGRLTTTSVGNDRADYMVSNLRDLYDYNVGYIIAGYEHRPDLISDLFYGTPEYWWLIMLFNNITDPFESFNVGERILIPKI
tara:strand:+ start:506 stop:796 length:291 start_codon:yes stop_codon:yes gene_type:complete